MATQAIEKEIIQSTHSEGEIRIPLIEIRGTSAGPTLAIVAGVHGAEYSGIEAAVRLSREIDPDTLRGRVRIVPIANLPAFLGRSEALCPVDRKNLNRLFPGDSKGTYADVLADMIFKRVVQGADCVLNVHGGDIFEALVPYVGIGSGGDPHVRERCRELGRIYGAPFSVEFANTPAPSYGTSLNRAAQEAGIPAILAEAGGEGVLEPAAVQIHLRGFANVMKWLGMLEGEIERDEPVQEMTSDFWPTPHEGIFYPALKLGQAVEKGQVIGTVTDWFGDEIETLTAPRDAWIIAIVTTPAARKNAIIYQVAY